MVRKLIVVAAIWMVAALAGAAAIAQEDQKTETLSGTFNVLWGDPKPGENADPDALFNLTNAGGSTELLLDRSDTASLGGPQAMSGEKVEVAATEAPGDAVEVLDLRPANTAGPAARENSAATVTGSRPAVTVLCRFGDSKGVTPKGASYFKGLMGSSEPGLDHFWREVSYSNINLAGSRVVGWYNLPQPRSYYMGANGEINLDRAAQGCASRANADVYFPNFTNVNLMFNQDIGCCAWGGGHTLSFDGVSKNYGTTWMPPWAYNNQFVLAHELGHSYGLPHSSGPYNETYDSDWDPMSDGSVCSPPDPVYGCVGVHTIAYHKDKLGWIPASRRYKATTATNQSITIQRIGTPATGGYLMAKIPINGSSTRFYTVESRRYIGYDARGQLPGEAVVIHKVDTTLNDRNAKVVDASRNGDPNDAGARWLPGETFTDAANGISVKVERATATGYTVTINPRAR